jgi:hypothetical protein
VLDQAIHAAVIDLNRERISWLRVFLLA